MLDERVVTNQTTPAGICWKVALGVGSHEAHESTNDISRVDAGHSCGGNGNYFGEQACMSNPVRQALDQCSRWQSLTCCYPLAITLAWCNRPENANDTR